MACDSFDNKDGIHTKLIKLLGLIPNSYIRVSVSGLYTGYILTISQKQTGRTSTLVKTQHPISDEKPPKIKL
jgi:hypothetical protein